MANSISNEFDMSTKPRNKHGVSKGATFGEYENESEMVVRRFTCHLAQCAVSTSLMKMNKND